MGGSRPEIESIHANAAAGEELSEVAGAGAEFERAFARSQQRRQSAGKPAVVAHDPVGEPEIATVVQRVRMIRWERIEEFGLERALHGVLR